MDNDRDRLIPSSGDRAGNQPLSPKRESQVDPSSYTAQDHTFPYPGYANTTAAAAWNGYSQYMNADGLHVMSPVVYNENPSVMYHSGYGYNTDLGYGQYSPVGSAMPPFMVDGQLYSAQQVPFSPTYYPQTPESENMLFNVNYPNLNSNPLPYPQPLGILGSYDSNFPQVPQHQRSSTGFGLVSGSQYPLAGATYQTPSFGGGASYPYSAPSDLNQFALDKGRRRLDSNNKDSDSVSFSNDIFNDRNRGPRASKIKGKSATEPGSVSGNNGGGKKTLSASGTLLDSLNAEDFVTDYEDAKFFIIKSFSEDNVHKSIKYGVWASTPHGNKKLDAAYVEAKEKKPDCPVFLFFSVNASGQFCGVAEMVGSVNFEKDAEYWQQDRWTGQFPVKWHIVKDVPNIRFRHILLDNNDNKPVTHSRDSQEVGVKQGVEMLKIMKEHEARTCILDDFYFYDDREKALRDRKSRQQQAGPAAEGEAGASSKQQDSVNQLASNLAQGLVLGSPAETQKKES